MAVLGTAKNARITYTGGTVVDVKVRGDSQYRIGLSRGNGTSSVNIRRFDYYDEDSDDDVFTSLAWVTAGQAGTISIEVVDSKFTITFSAYPEKTTIAYDSTYSNAGTWDAGSPYFGSLVSFENLDTAEPTGTNMQLNLGTDFKTVDSIQINIGSTWKDVTGASIAIDGAWKTIF